MTLEELRKLLDQAAQRVKSAADRIDGLTEESTDEERASARTELEDALSEAERRKGNTTTAEQAQRARDAFPQATTVESAETIVEPTLQHGRQDADERTNGRTGEARDGLGLEVYSSMSSQEARGGTKHFGEFIAKLHVSQSYKAERSKMAYAADPRLREEQRTLAEGSTSAGGALVAPQYVQEILDIARADAVAFKAGVQMRQTDTNLVYMPTLATSATAAWVAENGAMTPTDQTFGQQSMSVSKLMAGTKLSNELLADGDPAVGEIIQQDLARVISLKLDLGIFEGTGTAPEIRGLANTTGVTTGASLGANGATPSIDNLFDAFYALNAVNITDQENWAFVMHPRVLNTFRKVKDTTGNYILANAGGANAPVLQPAILNTPYYLSSQLSITRTTGTSTDTTNVYFGRFSDATVFMNGAFTIDMSGVAGDATNSAFWTDQTWIRAKQRVGFLVRRPGAIVVLTGVRP